MEKIFDLFRSFFEKIGLDGLFTRLGLVGSGFLLGLFGLIYLAIVVLSLYGICKIRNVFVRVILFVLIGAIFGFLGYVFTNLGIQTIWRLK